MALYKRLKEKDLVKDAKDYQELIYNRQIKVDNKRVEDPKLKLEENKKYLVQIGVLEVEL
jgi:predicted rRNA methylase YqxC with S4 and FtsJ domains